MDEDKLDGITEPGLSEDNTPLADWEKQLIGIIHDHERRAKITNIPRFRQMQAAYESIRKLFDGFADVSVSYSLKKLMRSIGVIRVEGSIIRISETDIFSNAASIANNIEVYPLTDGKVRMAFTFNDLAIPIE